MNGHDREDAFVYDDEEELDLLRREEELWKLKNPVKVRVENAAVGIVATALLFLTAIAVHSLLV